MQTLEQSLSQLVKADLITSEEAFFKCNKPTILQGLLD